MFSWTQMLILVHIFILILEQMFNSWGILLNVSMFHMSFIFASEKKSETEQKKIWTECQRIFYMNQQINYTAKQKTWRMKIVIGQKNCVERSAHQKIELHQLSVYENHINAPFCTFNSFHWFYNIWHSIHLLWMV